MLFGLQLFHREYDISELNLVNPVLFTKERPMHWPYFPPLQDNWCSDTTDDLKATWMGNVVGLVEEIIPPNRVTNKQRDHVRRFAYRLHYTMTQHLRDVVLNSIASFTKLWDAYTIKEIVKDDDLDDFTNPLGPPIVELDFKKPPMFLIKLVVDWEDHFVFVPTLEEMEEVILMMLDDICDHVGGIEDLVSRLDPKIIGVEKFQDIKTIARDHPEVETQRLIIKNSLSQNMGQCAKLKADYNPFIPITETNMEDYLVAFKIENNSIEAYETEVNRLNKIAADVMVASKDNVWLNMFVVDCKSIQEFVNKKALLFTKELLKQQLEAAYQRNTEVCRKFQAMSDILTKYNINLLNKHLLVNFIVVCMTAKSTKKVHTSRVEKTIQWCLMEFFHQI
jgi:hypothetical protein